MSCFVLEDLQSRQIRYLRAYYEERGRAGEEVHRKLNLVQLGVMITKTNMSVSPLVKYRSVAKYDNHLKKNYQIGIVVRQNGRIEVYADFMLVNEYVNPLYQCVDVDTDFNQFYLKFVKNCEKVNFGESEENLEVEIRQVRHFWRNRISVNTSKIKKDAHCWKHVLHKRISGYFRLYTQVLNFQMYMLVSHRDMISVFDMSQGANQNSEWIDTV